MCSAHSNWRIEDCSKPNTIWGGTLQTLQRTAEQRQERQAHISYWVSWGNSEDNPWWVCDEARSGWEGAWQIYTSTCASQPLHLIYLWQRARVIHLNNRPLSSRAPTYKDIFMHVRISTQPHSIAPELITPCEDSPRHTRTPTHMYIHI